MTLSAPQNGPIFEIGPDKIGDIRQHRPYFAVQLERNGYPVPFVTQAQGQLGAGSTIVREANDILKRISDYVTATQERGPITDIYLLSHGWHRNYYQATAAYDRLISRFSLLLDRQVLPAPESYHPLIIGVHWHSDPGEDGWVDPEGRRDKASYLQNVEMRFERPTATAEAKVAPGDRFTRVFEECFEFFGQMCARDVKALSSAAMTTKAQALARKLERFTLRDAEKALEHDKVATVWTCYHESLPKRVVTDQVMPPARGLKPTEAVTNLLRFAQGLVGIGVLLGLLLHSPAVALVKSSVVRWFTNEHDALRLWLHIRLFMWLPNIQQMPGTKGFFLKLLSGTWSDILWLPIVLVVLFVAALIGGGILAFMGRPGANKRKRGISYWAVAAWAPLEILFFLPGILTLLCTYFVSHRRQLNPRGIFAERAGVRNQSITASDRIDFRDPERRRAFPFRRRAAGWAMKPIAWYKEALDPQNPARDLFAGFENQLGFYEKQVLGVDAGASAAQFLSRIVTDMESKKLCIEGVRIHLVGHSFGGLVILNAVRHLALDDWCKTEDKAEDKTTIPIHSLTLLQAAVSSNWLEGETDVLNNITGKVGCAYSWYDTANGFYYPVGSGGRLAAGYVGLYGAPTTDKPAWRIPRLTLTQGQQDYVKFETLPADQGLFAMLVQPPDLISIVQHLGNPPVFNLDMSRIVYEGSVSLGGGHDDIFKDDVINLVWAVSRL